MARADRRRSQRTRPAAVTRRSNVVVEDTMFFPRLRRHAKWMFAFLALAFGLGFVAFGVGAGGIGIGDVFRGSANSGIPSISDAQDRVSENPKDAQAFLDLSTALQANDRTDEAIEAMEEYLLLKRKDTDALRELAGLYLIQVGDAQERYQLAQARVAFLAPAAAVLQGINLANKPLEMDAVSNAISSEISKDGNAALTDAQQASASAVDAYRRIAAATPKDPTVQLELAQTATDAGDYTTAIAAYERYVKLAPPNDPTVREVKRILKQLQSQIGG
jgi:tetratricopeptide (TPR) repeat protein